MKKKVEMARKNRRTKDIEYTLQRETSKGQE